MKTQRFPFYFVLLGLLFMSFAFLSSCGLVGAGNNIFGQDSGGVSNAGDGAVPKLRSRIEANPSLAGEDCEGNTSCEDTCKDIYEEKDSYKNCYKLSIGRASELEDVFFALLSGDSDELEDIDDDHLEKYLEVGTDGFLNKLIPRIQRKSNGYERLKNILTWIVEEERAVVPVLKSEDQDNEILEGLILAHCNVDSSTHKCQNTGSDVMYLPAQLCQLKVTNVGDKTSFPNANAFPSGRNCKHAANNAGSGDDTHTCPETSTSGDTSIWHPNGANISVIQGQTTVNNDAGIAFDYDSQSLFYCSKSVTTSATTHNCGTKAVSTNDPCTTLTHKKLAEVEEDEQDLFIALAGAGEVFFDKSADSNKEEAFALGHALLNKACDVNDDTSKKQCKASFYCYLDGESDSSWFNKKSVKDILGETIELQDCAYTEDNKFQNLGNS